MPVHTQIQIWRVTFDQARLDRQARAILASVGESTAELGILLVGDQRMKSLNHRYRGKDRTTDVLAFAMREAPHASPGLLGDVVIAVPTLPCAKRKRAGDRWMKSLRCYWSMAFCISAATTMSGANRKRDGCSAVNGWFSARSGHDRHE